MTINSVTKEDIKLLKAKIRKTNLKDTKLPEAYNNPSGDVEIKDIYKPLHRQAIEALTKVVDKEAADVINNYMLANGYILDCFDKLVYTKTYFNDLLNITITDYFRNIYITLNKDVNILKADKKTLKLIDKAIKDTKQILQNLFKLDF